MEKRTINELKRRILNKNRKKDDNTIISASLLKELEEYRLENKGASFSDAIDKYIRDNNIKASELYTRACIDRRVYSKMSNKDYRISKNTAICFCIAMNLSVIETQELLKRSGFALSNYEDFDIVITYFLEKKVYDIFEINGYLEELNLPLLGQKIRE